MTQQRVFRLACCLLMAVVLSACSSMDQNIVRMDEQVTPITVGDAADVSATVLAAAMMKAGFTSDQILRKGSDVHDALASSGGAQVRNGDSVLALFAVHQGNLFVTSRTTGTFQLPISAQDGPAPGSAAAPI